jgi:hypothetical protein
MKGTVKGLREGMVDCMADEFIMVSLGMAETGRESGAWLAGLVRSFLPGYSALPLLRCSIIRLVAYSLPPKIGSWAWKVISSLTVSIGRG